MTGNSYLDKNPKGISTHTLTWSVTIVKEELVNITDDFNSHAHVERDEFVCKKCHDNFISTHTLTWSVTGEDGHVAIATGISTHTLTWSVTELVP